jgi:mono/diheme cytochrome c family protein
MKDPSALMRVQAIRASETLYKAGDKSIETDVRDLAKDADTRVVLQSMLTLNLWKVSDISAVIRSIQAEHKERGIQEFGNRILQPQNAFGGGGFGGRGGFIFTAEQQAAVQRGEGIYSELCVSCHGPDGKGAPLGGAPAGTTMAPALAGSARVQGHRDYVINAVLHGLTGPIEGNTYSGVMVPMGSSNDDWIAAIASYVRNSFGNSGSLVTPANVATARAKAGARKPWTVEELEGSVPKPLAADPTWKASASHNPATAASALANGTWTTGAPQEPGMWFQIELPQAATITEIQFDSPGAQPGRGGPAGRGAGRGAAAAATPGPPAGSAAAVSSPGAQVSAAMPPGFGPGRGAIPAAAAGFPRGYKAEISMDGTTWAAPVAEGQGDAVTVITFTPVRAKFVRITQTATVENAPPWSIRRLRLYEPPGRF